MMSTISKEEYLKKYLSPANGDKTKKKKRKKLKTVQGRGMKIIDDDVKLEDPTQNEDDELKFLVDDEKPLIENVDARTEEEKELDEYRRSKMWRAMGAPEEEDVTSRLGGKKRKKQQRKKRYDSDSDVEVQRRRKPGDDDLDPRGGDTTRLDSDSDLDLPRGTRHDSDSDMEVPRRRNDSDGDLDLPRAGGKRTHRGSSDDNDVARRKNEDTRRRRAGPPTHDSDQDVARSNHKKGGMMGGGSGGLTSVTQLRRELDEKRRQESDLDKLASQYKNATAVFREKGTGKRIDKSKEFQEKAEKAEKRRQKEEKYNKWGKGLKQAELTAAAVADTLHESNKPLARYNDDEELEAMRKEEIRSEDPMAEYFARKKKKQTGDKPDRPTYRGPTPAPNRFNLMPGYRWDGLDRSNGFEKKFYEKQSNNEALKDEFYKWSVGDM